MTDKINIKQVLRSNQLKPDNLQFASFRSNIKTIPSPGANTRRQSERTLVEVSARESELIDSNRKQLSNNNSPLKDKRVRYLKL